MLADAIRSLILEEQARAPFIDGVDLDSYLVKLGEKAEIVSASAGERCRGLVAFYCNDPATRQAYISLVLVDPRDRGAGLGRSLVSSTLDIARRRGFTSCRLEVGRTNGPAYAMYRSLGFRVVEDREGKFLMEAAL